MLGANGVVLLEPVGAGYRVRLMDNTNAWDASYPGLVRLPDGALVTTTYGHWTKDMPPWIASVRVQVRALDRALQQVLAP